MVKDSAATKARILEAAFREFAAHGLAGARVDRIASNAHANKRAIYDYFGDKQQLFDAALADDFARGVENFPRLWNDLPEMAAQVFEYWASDPDRLRIRMWRQLERPQALEGEAEVVSKSIDELAAALPAGMGLDAVEVYALLWAFSLTWTFAPPALMVMHQAGRTAEDVHRAQRAAVMEAVRRIVAG